MNNSHRFGGDVFWKAAAWKIKKEMALRGIHCNERTSIGQNWLSIVSGALVSGTVLLACDRV